MELVGAYDKHTSAAQEFLDLLILTPAGRSVNQPRVRQTQNRLSPALLRQFEQDYRAGLLVKDLAAKYQINRDTVFQHVDHLGLPRRKPR